MNITVNALGVGKGKTLSDVIPRIKTAISNPLSTPIILTLPSTTSQFDLADQINSPDLIIINSATNKDTVVSTLKHYMIEHDQKFKVYCITHDALKMLSTSKQIKQKFDLILDEVINPFRRVTLWIDEDSKVEGINWSSYITIKEGVEREGYYRVETSMPPCSWSKQIEELTQLCDPNWTTWVSKEEYNKFKLDTKVGIDFSQELLVDVIADFNSVRVTAAHFDCTYMAHWLLSNDIKYVIDIPFEKTQADLAVYSTSYFNSITLQRNNPGVFLEYRNQMQAIFGLDSVPLVIRNNGKKGVIQYKYQNEQVLPHNVAGQNSYRHLSHFSFDAAVNESPAHDRWLRKCIKMTAEDIIAAGPAYLAYQAVSRSAIRMHNGTKVVVGIFCNKVCMSLFENYIDNTNVDSFYLLSITDVVLEEKIASRVFKQEESALKRKEKRKAERVAKRLNKKPPMTQAERSARARAKKALILATEEIILSEIMEDTNDRTTNSNLSIEGTSCKSSRDTRIELAISTGLPLFDIGYKNDSIKKEIKDGSISDNSISFRRRE